MTSNNFSPQWCHCDGQVMHVNDGGGNSGKNVIPLTECFRSWIISLLQYIISTAIDSSQSASANRKKHCKKGYRLSPP